MEEQYRIEKCINKMLSIVEALRTKTTNVIINFNVEDFFDNTVYVVYFNYASGVTSKITIFEKRLLERSDKELVEIIINMERKYILNYYFK